MKNSRTVVLLFILCCLTWSCSMSKIVTEPRINADIYVDGVLLDKQHTEIKRVGFPKKAHITAQYEGKIVGEITARRKIDINTLALCCVTSGIGLFVAWCFPETIVVPVQVFEIKKNKESKWDIQKKSKWEDPINR